MYEPPKLSYKTGLCGACAQRAGLQLSFDKPPSRDNYSCSACHSAYGPTPDHYEVIVDSAATNGELRLKGLLRQFTDEMPRDINVDKLIDYCEFCRLGFTLGRQITKIGDQWTPRDMSGVIWHGGVMLSDIRLPSGTPCAVVLWQALRSAYYTLVNRNADEDRDRE